MHAGFLKARDCRRPNSRPATEPGDCETHLQYPHLALRWTRIRASGARRWRIYRASAFCHCTRTRPRHVPVCPCVARRTHAGKTREPHIAWTLFAKAQDHRAFGTRGEATSSGRLGFRRLRANGCEGSNARRLDGAGSRRSPGDRLWQPSVAGHGVVGAPACSARRSPGRRHRRHVAASVHRMYSTSR